MMMMQKVGGMFAGKGKKRNFMAEKILEDREDGKIQSRKEYKEVK